MGRENISQTIPQLVETFNLSNEQQQFIELVLDERKNVLLLGKAGVGKSTATRALCDEADKRGLSYARTAPTGKAAINIAGETVHRLISKLAPRYGRTDSSWTLDFILIDEVSMVRADLLDKLSDALKQKMFSDLPFGGIQMVLVGDPGQLPPVINSKEKGECQYLDAHYLSHHFFGANSFCRTNWDIQELTKIFRQKDERFPKLLNLIREGKGEKSIAYLNKFRRTDVPRGVILTGRNADADFINSSELSKIDQPTYIYRAFISGELEQQDYPTDYELRLKLGARVMVIKNIYARDGSNQLELYNGDAGEVVDLDESSVVILSDRTGNKHRLSREDGVWTKNDSEYDEKTKKLSYKEKGKFMQIPLRLAWAITIHKAQGATIEEVTIDFRKPMFAAGQSYVGLSRGVTLDKVWILGRIRPRDIQTDDAVVDFLLAKMESEFVGVKGGSQFDLEEDDDERK